MKAVRNRHFSSNMSNYLSGRFDSHNILIKRAIDTKVISSDGVSIHDFILGNLTQIFGHNRLELKGLFNDVLDRYTNVGDFNNSETASVACAILNISNKHSLRFTNSGSEAVHLAIRLARASTGRSKILKFHGHYHGWFSEEISSFLPGQHEPGVPKSYASEVISINWNNTEDVVEVFSKYGDDIAAVICEPVLCHAGIIPPFDGFLHFLRQTTEKYASLLIFDECITGFRLALGGAQQYFGVNADLVTYSKALSGGVPIGVVAGTEAAMKPANEWKIFHASTFDSNPLSVATAGYVIERLKNTNTLELIKNNTEYFAQKVNSIFQELGIASVGQQSPGMYQLFFTSKKRIRNFHEMQQTDWRFYKKFVLRMKEKNIHIAEGQMEGEDDKRIWIGAFFLSSKHELPVLDKILGYYQYSSKNSVIHTPNFVF